MGDFCSAVLATSSKKPSRSNESLVIRLLQQRQRERESARTHARIDALVHATLKVQPRHALAQGGVKLSLSHARQIFVPRRVAHALVVQRKRATIWRHSFERVVSRLHIHCGILTQLDEQHAANLANLCYFQGHTQSHS